MSTVVENNEDVVINKFETTTHNFPSGSILLNHIPKTDYYGKKINLTGHAIWHASINFVNLINCERDIFQNKSVLEIGSGTGIIGFLLKKTFNNDINKLYLTDGEEEVVEVMKTNCKLNGFDSDQVECRQLWWGICDGLDDLYDNQPNGFDVIIGCDLFYNRSQNSIVIKVFQTISKLLSKNKDSSFYLSFTRRDMDIDVITNIADEFGFNFYVHNDYTWDIFDNNTDGQTEFWRDSIYIFKRK
jgi:SAM-dependent methyltransferase